MINEPMPVSGPFRVVIYACVGMFFAAVGIQALAITVAVLRSGGDPEWMKSEEARPTKALLKRIQVAAMALWILIGATLVLGVVAAVVARFL
jgi:hypothetical protein